MEAPNVIVLYGSQTGNAEDMAKRIGLQAKTRGQRVLVMAMDDFPLKLLPKQKQIIFVCSTTGHGQEPENMKTFYNFIRRRDLPRDCLSNLQYAVYGLGDSSYAKFNYVSKIINKRLKECGAKHLQELTTGDEQHQYGCDGIIYPKLDELWAKICSGPVENELSPVNNKTRLNSYSVHFYSADDSPKVPEEKFTPDFVSKYNLKRAICTRNERLTSESHFQDTRLLCFKAKDPIHYEPGDVCTIYPTNSDANTETLIELLNLDPDQQFRLKKLDPRYMVNYLYDFLADGITIRDLVKHCLDIQSVPRRSFFEFLWPFSDDELEREKLKEFASTEGQEEVYDYCVRPKRSILEVLLDFPNTVRNIKFEYIFDLIPPIKPRSFSIASALSQHPGEVHLIVGVVKYKTLLKKTRMGLCSNYLARLEPSTDIGSASSSSNSELRFFIRSSSFKLPQQSHTPIIMVGPGLGIAPFRSFIEERARNRAPLASHLYFGCRFRDKDFYFENELAAYQANGVIRLRVAHSREQPRQYVQDLLQEDASLIRRLMTDEAAVFYVAGNSKLPEDVRTLLGKILSSELGDSEQSLLGDRLVAQLETQNRIQYDCW